ncbi:hypothetical protein [Pseudomonas fluorescens]|uniref:hypothetical protein n=1 Tax=Pseudomonas fluorescens TaxID=294 RepID=UPI0012405EE0|nr:hypothetical protein [Pseudomonas fluorescens]
MDDDHAIAEGKNLRHPARLAPSDAHYVCGWNIPYIDDLVGQIRISCRQEKSKNCFGILSKNAGLGAFERSDEISRNLI